MVKLSSSFVIVCAAAFLTVTANFTFFSEVAKVYPPAENILFLVSLSIVLFASITFTLALFSLVLPFRFIISLFLIVAAVSGYYTDQFGIIINSDMLDNVLQTDAAEVRDLITTTFVLRVLLLGVAAVVLLWRLPLQQSTFLSRLLRHSAVAITAILVVAVGVFSFSDQYAGFFRQHKILRTYTNPLMPIYAAIQHIATAAATPEDTSLAKTAEDAHIPEADDGHELIILVVGETARRNRFSLNGYPRQTNPELEKEPRIINYSNIVSCGTSTAISVPCMFSASGHKNFSVDKALHQENVLDILQRTGVSVLWRDNNSSSKGVADRVRYEDFRKPQVNPVCDIECRDVGMLAGLQDYIDSQPGDILIVLHQMGNHGPAYFKRYPPAFERFTPACHSLELSDCSEEEINNAYDNAILYTDYFLSQVIQLLKHNTPTYETAMLYVSDHGESLGEHGLYLHGAPYLFAPSEQTQIPVILWLGETADIDLQKAFAQKDKQNSHDAVFHSLLAAFEVETTELHRESSLFEVGER